jgi:amino acid transporter
MVAIVLIGGVNLLGPKHVAGPAMVVASAMVVCTLVLVVCAMVQIDWGKLDLGSMWHQPLDLWRAFVAVVLALSGVEAISNLTGVMKQPVTKTALVQRLLSCRHPCHTS